MTKRDFIYSIMERVRAMSDDSDITEEYVSHLIDTKRAMLIKQQYSAKYWNLPYEITQELCIGMERIDKVDGFSCAGKILTSTTSIPASINFKGKDGPIMVSSKDLTGISFNVIPLQRLPFATASRYSEQLIFATVDRNNKLIIVSGSDKVKFIKSVRLADVFERPDESYSLQCNDGSISEPWDMDYPLEAAMFPTISDMVFKDLAGKIQIPEDKVNDADDDRRG